MRGVVAPVFGLLAVFFITLGALNATIWKPSREVSANTEFSGARYVVTDPGMLNLFASSTTITVNNETPKGKTPAQTDPKKEARSERQMCVAFSDAKDAVGWLAGQKYTRITGLNDWKALSNKVATGPKLATANDSDAVAFKDSDMWTSVRCADSSVSLSLNDVKSNQVMIVDMGADASAKANGAKSAQPKVDIQIRWVRDRVPNNALPFFVAAGLCIVMTILSASVFAMMSNESFKRKRELRRKMREEAKAEEVSISEAMTGSLKVLRKNLPYNGRNYRPSHKRQPSDGGDKIDGATGSSDDAVMASSVAGGDKGKSAPSIIDPTRRNLVADMQMQGDENDGDESLGDDGEQRGDDVSRFAPNRGETGKSSGSGDGSNSRSRTADSHDGGSEAAESSADGSMNEDPASDALRDYLNRLSSEISGAQSASAESVDSADSARKVGEEDPENKQADQMDSRGNKKAESREGKNVDAHEGENSDDRKEKLTGRNAKQSDANTSKKAVATSGQSAALGNENADGRGSEQSRANDAKRSSAGDAEQSGVGRAKNADGRKNEKSADHHGKRPAVSGDKAADGRKGRKPGVRDGKQSVAVRNKKPEARKNEMAADRKDKSSNADEKKAEARKKSRSDVRNDKKMTGKADKKDGDKRSAKSNEAIGKKPATNKGGEKKA